MPNPITPILDNFNRADTGPPLSASWTNAPGGHAVVSNQVPGTNTGSRFNTSFTANQEVYVTYATAVSGSGYVLARWQGGTDWNTDSYYFALAERRVGTDELSLFYYNGASSTQVGSTANSELDDGDQISLRIIGTSFEVSENGVSRITGTDSNITGGGFIGFGDGDSGGAGRFDNFGGGSIVSKPPIMNRALRFFRKRG